MLLTLPNYSTLQSDVARHAALADPVSWVKTCLRDELYSKQIQILNSVRDYRRTAVHACHDSGKSKAAGGWIVPWWIENHLPGEAGVVTTSRSWPQVRNVLWKETHRSFSKVNLLVRVNQTEWHLVIKDGKTGNTHEEIVAFGRKPDDTDYTGLHGMHAKYMFALGDEAGGLKGPIITALMSLISNKHSKILLIGNADDPLSEFAKICRPGSGWNVIHIDAFDTPNFTDEKVSKELESVLISKVYVAEVLRDCGGNKNNPIYVSKVRGLFPEFSSDGLIPLSWILAAQQRAIEPGLPSELGVDVGGGNDKNVICHRQGGHARIVLEDQVNNTMTTLGNVRRVKEETKATLAKVDSIGIGKGCIDRVDEINAERKAMNKRQIKPLDIVGIDVRKSRCMSDEDREKYRNVRAKSWWELRQRFDPENGDIDIDPLDDVLAAQLVQYKYKTTSDGKIQIDDKGTFEGGSPDRADALCNAFADVPMDREEEGMIDTAVWGT